MSIWQPDNYPKKYHYFIAALQLVLALWILIGWLDFSPGLMRLIGALLLALGAGVNFWNGRRLPPDDASPRLHT